MVHLFIAIVKDKMFLIAIMINLLIAEAFLKHPDCSVIVKYQIKRMVVYYLQFITDYLIPFREANIP